MPGASPESRSVHSACRRSVPDRLAGSTDSLGKSTARQHAESLDKRYQEDKEHEQRDEQQANRVSFFPCRMSRSPSAWALHWRNRVGYRGLAQRFEENVA